MPPGRPKKRGAEVAGLTGQETGAQRKKPTNQTPVPVPVPVLPAGALGPGSSYSNSQSSTSFRHGQPGSSVYSSQSTYPSSLPPSQSVTTIWVDDDDDLEIIDLTQEADADVSRELYGTIGTADSRSTRDTSLTQSRQQDRRGAVLQWLCNAWRSRHLQKGTAK
jgi:hypothetical protein